MYFEVIVILVIVFNKQTFLVLLLDSIRVIDDKTAQLSPPESSRAFYSWGFNEKEVQYTFKKVFDVDSTQKQVFDQVKQSLD